MNSTLEKAVVVLCLLLLVAFSVPAQEAQPNPQDAQKVVAEDPSSQVPKDKKSLGSTEIVVVAPPLVQEASATEQGTTVITVGSQQVEDLNAQGLAESLRRVPGVVISRYNPIGSFGGGDGCAIYIRGHGTGRPGAEIATLIDGIPVFAGVWTHPLLDINLRW